MTRIEQNSQPASATSDWMVKSGYNHATAAVLAFLRQKVIEHGNSANK